jgi:hypothetical protein
MEPESSLPCSQEIVTGHLEPDDLIQPPIPWVPEVLSLGVKWPGRESDHLPPSSDEVRNTWSYTSTPQYAFMAWCSVKESTETALPFSFNSK